MHLPRSSVEIIAPPIPAYDTISCLVEKNSAIEWEVLHLAANSSFFGFVPIFFSSPCWRGVFLPDIILQHVLGVQFPVLSPPPPPTISSPSLLLPTGFQTHSCFGLFYSTPQPLAPVLSLASISLQMLTTCLYFLRCPLITCLSSLEKCLFRSFACFLIGLFAFYCRVMSFFIFWMLDPCQRICKYFLPFNHKFLFLSSSVYLLFWCFFCVCLI